MYSKQFFKVPVEVSGRQSPAEEQLCATAQREGQNPSALGAAPRPHQHQPAA